MPIKVEKLPEESIICATVSPPFNPGQDIPAMFAQFVPLRMAIQGKAVLILDITATVNNPGAFSQLVVALSAASQGIKTHKETGTGGPPILIFIGTNPIVELASTAIEQDQYGGVGAHLCASHDEALALAREKLSEPDEKLPESDEKSPD